MFRDNLCLVVLLFSPSWVTVFELSRPAIAVRKLRMSCYYYMVRHF